MIRQYFQQVEQHLKKFQGPEIKDDGLMLHGRLVQWAQIYAWDWEWVGTALVLNLEVSCVANFPDPIRLCVQRSQREAVETLLVDSIVCARFTATRSMIVSTSFLELSGR